MVSQKEDVLAFELILILTRVHHLKRHKTRSTKTYMDTVQLVLSPGHRPDSYWNTFMAAYNM
eukprot:scaffold37080_cov48-Attheya_sp.AAC.5